MNKERQAKIESYGRAEEDVRAALERFPLEMWQYRPAAGEWSIQEILIHLADSEVNSYVRCRRFIAEPGETLMAYDENRWARRLDYQRQSAEDALALFGLLRRMSYDLIRDLPEEAWRSQAHHPERGVMTLDDWLETYEQHTHVHIAQMEAVYESWRKAKAA